MSMAEQDGVITGIFKVKLYIWCLMPLILHYAQRCKMVFSCLLSLFKSIKKALCMNFCKISATAIFVLSFLIDTFLPKTLPKFTVLTFVQLFCKAQYGTTTIVNTLLQYDFVLKIGHLTTHLNHSLN